MIKNYFRIALRNLWKHKVFSVINIMGLAVGMAACFLIYLYVHFETSYDSFNSKADRIYRIVTDIKTPSDVLHWSSTSAPMAINMPSTIKSIQSKWNQAISNRPFDYTFLDESFDKQYRAEDRFGKLFFNFAILAIFISCLGLLGLASYSTLQRSKEISVRKVLGASVSNITTLLSKDFIRLVLIGLIIASPVAWFVMNKWLQVFAYRINISWGVFIFAGILAILIALFTISFQAIKAAIANPVKRLRSE